jgi:hypothetical protein
MRARGRQPGGFIPGRALGLDGRQRQGARSVDLKFGIRRTRPNGQIAKRDRSIFEQNANRRLEKAIAVCSLIETIVAINLPRNRIEWRRIIDQDEFLIHAATSDQVPERKQVAALGDDEASER